jgi:hypothetical protein
MKTLLIRLPMLLCAALLASAEAPAAAERAKAGDSATSAPKSEGVTTGSLADQAAQEEAKRKRQFDDCIAMWDSGTHMTKGQWRRTCKRQLENIPDL